MKKKIGLNKDYILSLQKKVRIDKVLQKVTLYIGMLLSITGCILCWKENVSNKIYSTLSLSGAFLFFLSLINFLLVHIYVEELLSISERHPELFEEGKCPCCGKDM